MTYYTIPDSESESDTSPSSISESSDSFVFPLKQKSVIKQEQGGRCIQRPAFLALDKRRTMPDLKTNVTGSRKKRGRYGGSVADPVLCWPLDPWSGSGVRDGENLDPISGIKISDHISKSTVRVFFMLKILKFFVNSVIRIRILDREIQTRDKHPGSAEHNIEVPGTIPNHILKQLRTYNNIYTNTHW